MTQMMAALAIAARNAESLVSRSPPPSVLFFVDNIAAVQQIANLRPHPAQASSIHFRKAIDNILSTHPHISIELYWISSYTGIEGNERADFLASEAGNLTPTPLFNRTIIWTKAQAKGKAIKAWRQQWHDAKHSETVCRHLPHQQKGDS
jgi:hypothetical protein